MTAHAARTPPSPVRVTLADLVRLRPAGESLRLDGAARSRRGRRRPRLAVQRPRRRVRRVAPVSARRRSAHDRLARHGAHRQAAHEGVSRGAQPARVRLARPAPADAVRDARRVQGRARGRDGGARRVERRRATAIGSAASCSPRPSTTSCGRRSARAPALRLLQTICTESFWQPPATADALEADAERALQRLTRVARPGSLIFLLSDFRRLGADAERHLRQLAGHCDLLLVHCLRCRRGRTSAARPLSNPERRAGRSAIETGERSDAPPLSRAVRGAPRCARDVVPQARNSHGRLPHGCRAA